MAVIIPKEVLKKAGAKEGDVITLSLPIPKAKRTEVLAKIAGIDSQAKPFAREKGDRL